MAFPKRISQCIYNLVFLTFVGLTSGLDLSAEEILSYKVSWEVSSTHPLYWAGYDVNNAPVWILNLGQWDIRSFAENGLVDELDIWFGQCILRMRDSAIKEDKLTGFTFIIDMDGFPFWQKSSPTTVTTIVGWFELFQKLVEPGEMNHGWILNSGSFFERVWNLAGPLLGDLEENIEVYGATPEIWKPKLLKKIPRNQLPEKLGGYPNFKPLAVYVL